LVDLAATEAGGHLRNHSSRLRFLFPPCRRREFVSAVYAEFEGVTLSGAGARVFFSTFSIARRSIVDCILVGAIMLGLGIGILRQRADA
jgi:hypothetical protein